MCSPPQKISPYLHLARFCPDFLFFQVHINVKSRSPRKKRTNHLEKRSIRNQIFAGKRKMDFSRAIPRGFYDPSMTNTIMLFRKEQIHCFSRKNHLSSNLSTTTPLLNSALPQRVSHNHFIFNLSYHRLSCSRVSLKNLECFQQHLLSSSDLDNHLKEE